MLKLQMRGVEEVPVKLRDTFIASSTRRSAVV